jgi:hypothetical protein
LEEVKYIVGDNTNKGKGGHQQSQKEVKYIVGDNTNKGKGGHTNKGSDIVGDNTNNGGAR